MSNSFLRRGAGIVAVIAVVSFSSSNSHAQYTNGIYAEFNTSMGSFTCRLEYALAPKACANFIGLATGQRYWLDAVNGQVRTNFFYNGLIFHRVITNFMNQAGSPNGQGTDGPGYAFEDEFNPTLRHDGFGVLSSANSGPDSNGAQFFITVVPTPWLNDVHTVFGRLYGGSNVVYAINRVPTVGNKPVTDVVIQSVNIRRIGAAAMAFDINSQGLPMVTNLNLQIAKAGTNVSLNLSNRLYADNRLYTSTNLLDWAGEKLGIEVSGLVSNAFTRSATSPRQFFRAAQIQYANSTFSPKQLTGRTLTLVFSVDGPGTIVNTFTTSSGGTYTWSLGSPGTVLNYVWDQAPYNGTIWPIEYSGIVPMTLKLNFDSATAGTFAGTAYTSPFTTSVSGTFTLLP